MQGRLPLRLLLLLLCGGSVRSALPTGKFLHLTDLHWDPFYGTADAYRCTPPVTGSLPVFGQFACDSPTALLRSLLMAAKAAVPDPSFIVVTGDFIRHAASAMPSSNTTSLQSIAELTRWIVETFDSGSGIPIPLIPTLGNNDVVPDYSVQVPGASAPGDYFLTRLADAWQAVLPAAARETFRFGGFYSVEISPGLTVLSVNTVVYSPHHEPDTEGLTDPYGQFQWLDTQLSAVEASGGAVYIVGHIPPVVDTFSTHPLLWLPQYINRYIDIIDRHADVVKTHLFGHIHGDEFRTWPSEGGHPVFISGSVSPIYGCNPSFRIWEFDSQSKALLDYEVWYAELPQETEDQVLDWKAEYSARQLYGLANLSNPELRRLGTSFATDDAAWNAFVHTYHAGAPFFCDDACRKETVCLLTQFRAADFKTCINTTESKPSLASPLPEHPSSPPTLDLFIQHGGWIIAGVLLLGIFPLFGIGAWLVMRWRKKSADRYATLGAPFPVPVAPSHSSPHI